MVRQHVTSVLEQGRQLIYNTTLHFGIAIIVKLPGIGSWRLREEVISESFLFLSWKIVFKGENDDNEIGYLVKLL